MKKPTKSTKPTKSIKPDPHANPLRVGNTVFIRTVTLYHVGRIVAVDTDFIVLADASWVAWTQRFSETLATGALDEVEQIPNGRAAVGIGAIVDAVDWPHPVPVPTK